MTTYNSTYPYNPQRRKKQRYVILERVIDFTANHPNDSVTTGVTSAWKANDVLEAIFVTAGQTVLAVQCEIIRESADSGDVIKIGDGNNNERWGIISLYHGTRTLSTTISADKSTMGIERQVEWTPKYYPSADTIDITILKAAMDGKIRLIVHMLEDDR